MSERRYTPASEIKIEQRAGDKPKIVGTAAVHYDGSPGTEYDLFENVKERIMPGAFDRALEEGDDVVALFNHDDSQILGRTPGTLKLHTDSRGLHYEIDPPQTGLGKAVTVAIQRGDIRGSSFAFSVDQQSWVTEDGVDVRQVHSVKLFDVSPVTRPAYESTNVGLRSADNLAEIKASHERYKQTQERIKRAAEVNAKLAG